MRTRSQNLVLAAAVLGSALVLAGAVLAVGVWIALDRASARLTGAVDAHADAVSDAGAAIGPPVQQSIERLSSTVATHAAAVTEAGDAIAHPQIRVVEPVPIREPLTVRGPEEDGALPVDAQVLE